MNIKKQFMTSTFYSKDSLLRKIGSFHTIFFLTAIFLLFNVHTLQADVLSMSKERLSQGDGASYWQVEVTCKGESESIAIRQQGAQSNWCTDSDPVETCESSKEALADKICNTALLSILRPSAQGQASTVQKAGQFRRASQAELDAALQRERDQQARLAREAESNRILVEQARLRQERIQLDQEKQNLLDIETGLNRQIAEIEEKLAQLK